MIICNLCYTMTDSDILTEYLSLMLLIASWTDVAKRKLLSTTTEKRELNSGYCWSTQLSNRIVSENELASHICNCKSNIYIQYSTSKRIVLIYVSCLINIHNTILGASNIHQKLNSTWKEENCINFLDLTTIKNRDTFEFNQETYYPLPKTISYIANPVILMNIRKQQRDTLQRN
jgi:hypothetical protein